MEHFRYLRDDGRLLTAIVCHPPDDVGKHQFVKELRGIMLEEERHGVTCCPALRLGSV